jgi:L-ascorbate metabolism protein UlaG (beta-lactamase superfamily)
MMNAGQKAIKHLDRLLQLPDSSSMNIFVLLYLPPPACTSLCKTTRAPPKAAVLWQLYNQGYIAQIKGMNIGFDVVSTRNVFNLYWPVPEVCIQNLAELLDVLFVSHRHPDHMDLDLIGRMIRLEKLVVVPKEIMHLMPRRVVGLEGNEERQLISTRDRHLRLNVFAHRGRHIQDNNRFISHRNYEVESENGFCILHTGDHDYTDFIKHIGDVDLMIFKFGQVNPLISDKDTIANLTKNFRARLFIPSGLNEIGNQGERRISYESAKEVFENCPVPYRILTWGESLKVL